MENTRESRFREPYEIIEAKLNLAELTLDLSTVTKEKWIKLETMRDVLAREEVLLKLITEASSNLQILLDKNKEKE